MIEISLTERGPPTIISISDWTSLGLEFAMRPLANQGIVRLMRTASGVLVAPGHYVGEARLSGAVLRILPKSSELLAAMEGLALRAASRHITESLPHLSEDGDHRDPAQTFVRALFDCIREGIPWRYARRSHKTSFPRGKLEFAKTIRSAASRGIAHNVVVSVPDRVQEAEFARVVRAAHTCLAAVPGATAKIVGDAQVGIAAFDWAVPYGSLDDALNAARRLTKSELGIAAKELAIRSLEILLAEHAAAGVVQPLAGGIARFRNLEELWERCVLTLVQGSPTLTSDSEARFHGIRNSGYCLLENGGPELDPDVVTFRGEEICLIADAKYKLVEQHISASAADLYQLTAYVRRTSARLGLLVYLAIDAPSARIIGETQEGAPILVVSISPGMLLSEGENLLERLLSRTPNITQSIEKGFANGLR